jgi:sec-independent protein translocase protein TatC
MQYISHYFFEIRLRVFYSIFACILSLTLSYIYKYELFYLFSKPFLIFSRQFIFFELTEGLYTMIRISGSISILTTIPYLIYQFWSFVIPSYYIFERKKLNFFLWSFFILILFEFLFIYWFLFPKLCEFLVSFEIKSLLPQNEFSPVSIEFTPRIASYIKVTIQLFSFFLLFFQLPFLFIGLFANNILTSANLSQQRKFVFFLCLFVSAFISPPDVVSQLFISSILYIIYEIIIWIGFIFQSSKNKYNFFKKKN